MKKTKIIVPAMGLLLLGTAASVTGTVAWFSINNQVSVTGMVVKTKVGSNILIAENNVEAEFASGLDQDGRTGILEPVSTVDGVNFFYHSTLNNVGGDGHSMDNVFVPYVEGAAFDSNYGYNPTANSDCLGYMDYSFYIKATNGESVARNLVMSKCNITYRGNAVGDKAWRVALFAQTTAKTTTVADSTVLATSSNMKSILKISDAAYFNDVAVKDDDPADAYGSVTNLNAAANVQESVGAAATTYCKVIVRLWLEGNDTTCNNSTYAQLSGDFRLDLAFTFSASNGVTALGTVGAAVAAGNDGANSISASVTLTDGKIANEETPASYQWYDEADDSPISGATTSAYTNGATAKTVYCLVTTNRGNVYRTNSVALKANAQF